MPPEENERSISASTRLAVSEMRARDARGRRTMATLHSALLDLIEEENFERITIDEIVGRAGIGRSTFYRHYEDKQALLEEIARKEIMNLMTLALPVEDKLDSMPVCRRVATYVGEHQKLWSVLLTGGAAGAMRQKFIELATPAIDDEYALGPYGIPIDLSATWGVAATVEVLAWWLKDPRRATIEEVAGYLDRLAVRPAFSPV